MTRRPQLLAAATLVALTTILATGSHAGSLAGAADGTGGDRVAADSSWGPRPGKPGRG